MGVEALANVSLRRDDGANRATVDALEESLAVKQLEVLPDAVLGHVKALRKARDRHAAFCLDEGGYGILSFLGKHGYSRGVGLVGGHPVNDTK